jgi:hypothetical protein
MDERVVVIELVSRRDGKRYPLKPPDHQQLNRIRWLEHNLVCRDGLTLRAAQKVMLEQYMVRRSLGAIHNDIQRFECPACEDQPAGRLPAQEQPPPAVHQHPGGLTGAIERG